MNINLNKITFWLLKVITIFFLFINISCGDGMMLIFEEPNRDSNFMTVSMLDSASISSNFYNPRYAYPGSTVTVSFTSNVA